ncbi:hypothetical protein [Winogradskyella immobilis]|uniref:Lipoprotein n=1 Tax=Winogradskyella immobilis TaxID=2816852 RepID=A0ABS8EQI6_9FLAO|nr:hypothetical protein [Winogradskyella immobilis]MCC1485443.1 hypothetical protein [Winogradskyella immobilis]MCG0017535.1 hypothetical protein [Winogradskyella immobilis]
MKIKPLLFLTLFTLFFSCGNNNSEKDSEVKEVVNDLASKITQKKIEDLRYTDYVLSDDAKDVVANWIKYQELVTQIGFLKKVDFSFFKDEQATLAGFTEELKTTIPETLNTNRIKARITVLETQLLLLNNNLTIDNLPIEDKLRSIKSLLESISHLNYLINKKLEFDKANIERPE